MTTALGTHVQEMIAERRTRLLGELAALEEAVKSVTELEVLWHQLKFVILEGDPVAYFQIRGQFNEYRKAKIMFEHLKQHVFALFRQGLTAPVQEMNIVNLLTHIWGYLKKQVKEESERKQALALIRQLSDGDLGAAEETYELFSELYRKYGKADLINPTLSLS